MLFLVISTPRPDRPSTLVDSREGFWKWIKNLQDGGQVIDVYSRLGRGVVALFKVDTHETMHRLVNEWTEIVPAHFDLYPLIDPEAAKAYLATQKA